MSVVPRLTVCDLSAVCPLRETVPVHPNGSGSGMSSMLTCRGDAGVTGDADGPWGWLHGQFTVRSPCSGGTQQGQP